MIDIQQPEQPAETEVQPKHYIFTLYFAHVVDLPVRMMLDVVGAANYDDAYTIAEHVIPEETYEVLDGSSDRALCLCTWTCKPETPQEVHA